MDIRKVKVCPRAGMLVWLVLGLMCGGARAQVNARGVLVVASYHPGQQLETDQLEGLRAVISTNAEIYVEYLDAKRMGRRAEYLDLFARVLIEKYFGRRMDVVVTLNDDAYRLMRAYRDRILPGKPVVACGVSAAEAATMEHPPWPEFRVGFKPTGFP